MTRNVTLCETWIVMQQACVTPHISFYETHIFVYAREEMHLRPAHPVRRTDAQKSSAGAGANGRVCGSVADVDGDNALK